MGDICKYGEPSVTSRTNTPEFDAGHERTFGPSSTEIRAPKRTTYVYRRINGELKAIEVGGPEDTGPVEESDEARTHVVSDLYMDGTTVQVAGGKTIDIGSRAKRRAYMRENDLTDYDDWKGTWEKAAKERELLKSGQKKDPERRFALGKALYEASKKQR